MIDTNVFVSTLEIFLFASIVYLVIRLFQDIF